MPEIKSWEESYYELANLFIERNTYLMFLLGKTGTSLFDLRKEFEAINPTVQDNIKEDSRKTVKAITEIKEETPKREIGKTRLRVVKKKIVREEIPTE